MVSKKIVFSLVLGIAIGQSMSAVDPIFDLLDNPLELKEYLKEYPKAINATLEHQIGLPTPCSVLCYSLNKKYKPEITKILLAAGARPNEIISFMGLSGTLLNSLAHTYSFRDVSNYDIARKAALLISYGADDSRPDSKGLTPIEISPELMTDVAMIQEQEEQARQEELARSAFITEGGQNTGLAAELRNLLFLPPVTDLENQ